MATTTARQQAPALKRNMTTDSSPSTHANNSPFSSATNSASNTSLESLAEVKNARGVLLDTYGNEFEIPDYTIKQIRDAIPKHCFERSGLRGLGYVARDIASLAATFYVFHNYVTPETIPSTAVRAGLWAVYTVIQGLFGTGLWVLAHECGHQSFSPSKVLNDTVGWFCHSALLVPYFSWKISHGKHHKATGHMERDMVFVPKTRDVYASRIGKLVHELDELTEETPIATLLHSIGQQLAGWPLYIICNVTGHNFHERQPEGKGKGKKTTFIDENEIEWQDKEVYEQEQGEIEVGEISDRTNVVQEGGEEPEVEVTGEKRKSKEDRKKEKKERDAKRKKTNEKERQAKAKAGTEEEA
jgi:omega-6 fatty acid desaturase (delta-12 desaturase)